MKNHPNLSLFFYFFDILKPPRVRHYTENKKKKTNPPTLLTTIHQITFIFFIPHCLYSNKPLKHALQLKTNYLREGKK